MSTIFGILPAGYPTQSINSSFLNFGIIFGTRCFCRTRTSVLLRRFQVRSITRNLETEAYLRSSSVDNVSYKKLIYANVSGKLNVEKESRVRICSHSPPTYLRLNVSSLFNSCPVSPSCEEAKYLQNLARDIYMELPKSFWVPSPLLQP